MIVFRSNHTYKLLYSYCSSLFLDFFFPQTSFNVSFLIRACWTLLCISKHSCCSFYLPTCPSFTPVLSCKLKNTQAPVMCLQAVTHDSASVTLQTDKCTHKQGRISITKRLNSCKETNYFVIFVFIRYRYDSSLKNLWEGYSKADSMETPNTSQTINTSSGDNSSLFSGSPYTTVEIVLIILVAGSLSLITVIGNILVMLSIKVWNFLFFFFSSTIWLISVLQTSISGHLEKHTQTQR